VTLTLTSSTFSENSAAVNGAGIFAVTSTLQISDSTLSGNFAAADGGAIYLKDSTLSLSNNTLSANASDQAGGGIYNVGGTITVTNSTFSGNSAALQGGALFNDIGYINMANSILANSPSGGNCSGEIGDGGHNIDSGETCGFDPANGSLPNTDPSLGLLQDNGGPTWTHALMQGSPAIDVADPLICPPTDQRGVSRPYDGDGDGDSICDIGSYEFDNFLLVPIMGVSISGPASGELLNTYNFTATATPVSLTLPVIYTWQASGQVPVTHTSGLSDVVSFQWDVTGIQAITLTASNGLATVSTGHLITITDEPISGLLAHNDSPTELGYPTTLSATVASGTNITFIWDFGDGGSASGAVVAHTYAEEGVYTTLVTATNSANTLTSTTVVTVLAPPAEGERFYLPLVEK
jgi:predicted outer membrane repeat protein